jgi:hypothetical protein
MVVVIVLVMVRTEKDVLKIRGSGERMVRNKREIKEKSKR